MPLHAEGPSRLPAGLTVTGDLSSEHDLSIDGAFEGQITVPEQHLTIGKSARVKARIIARSVIVAGRLDGTITATESVQVHVTASVRAHVQTPSLTLAEGAQFNGSVDPNRTEAAMLVARYRQKQA